MIAEKSNCRTVKVPAVFLSNKQNRKGSGSEQLHHLYKLFFFSALNQILLTRILAQFDSKSKAVINFYECKL